MIASFVTIISQACKQRHPIGNEWEIQWRGGGRFAGFLSASTSLCYRRRRSSGKGWWKSIIELEKLVGKLVCFRLLSLLMMIVESNVDFITAVVVWVTPALPPWGAVCNVLKIQSKSRHHHEEWRMIPSERNQRVMHRIRSKSHDRYRR